MGTTKNKFIKFASGTILSLGLFSQSVYAGWVGPAKVTMINIGGNGYNASYIQLEGVAFSGCNNNVTAVMTPDNLNYKDMLAALMTAKVAQIEVRINYSGCQWNYSVIQEIVF